MAVLTQQQKHNNVMNEYLMGTNCHYSFSDLIAALRAGISDNLREQYWITESQPGEMLAPLPDFDELIRGALLPRDVYDQIMADLYRSEVLADLSLVTVESIGSLYRGLIAHAALRPDIGYTQGQNFLWAQIIHCIARPQHQLLIADNIVRRILPYYFTTDLVGARIDALVLRAFLKRECPNLELVMVKTYPEVQTLLLCLTSSFFTKLFISTMPMENTMRLLDMVMFRGAVELIEFMLRIFIYSHNKYLFAGCPTWADYVKKLSDLLREKTTFDAIMSERNKLPNGHIVQENFAKRRADATRIIFLEVATAAREKAMEDQKNRRRRRRRQRQRYVNQSDAKEK